jgi:hypothetical protein
MLRPKKANRLETFRFATEDELALKLRKLLGQRGLQIAAAVGR